FLVAGRRLAEQLLQRFFRQHASAEERLENRVVQRLQGAVFVAGRRIAPGVAEPARQQQVGELRHEILEIDLVEQVAGVFGVAVFHFIAADPPSAEPALRSVYVRPLVVVLLLALRDGRNRPLLIPELLFARWPPYGRLGRVIAALLAAADLLQRIEAFEHEVDTRCEERRRAVRRNP